MSKDIAAAFVPCGTKKFRVVEKWTQGKRTGRFDLRKMAGRRGKHVNPNEKARP